MKAVVLTGSKSDIAEQVIRMDGTIHEAIVFVEESSNSTQGSVEENIFAEMEPFMVQTGGADYSRDSIYTCMEGE